MTSNETRDPIRHGASAIAEVVFNLWFVHDGNGSVFSLRARAYVGCGSDDASLTMLQDCALTDYLIARPFPVPEAFHLRPQPSGETLPIASVLAITNATPATAPFEEAMRALEAEMPAQSRLRASECSLVCITPLFAMIVGDTLVDIIPAIGGQQFITCQDTGHQDRDNG